MADKKEPESKPAETQQQAVSNSKEMTKEEAATYFADSDPKGSCSK